MRNYFVALLSVVIGVSVIQQASAIAPFKKAFDEEFVSKSDSEEFKAAFKKAGCNTCHLKGQKKEIEHLNDFAKELEKRIEGNANERIKEAREAGTQKEETEKVLAELKKAFEEVVKVKTKAGDTFGDRIKAGKLPASEE